MSGRVVDRLSEVVRLEMGIGGIRAGTIVSHALEGSLEALVAGTDLGACTRDACAEAERCLREITGGFALVGEIRRLKAMHRAMVAMNEGTMAELAELADGRGNLASLLILVGRLQAGTLQADMVARLAGWMTADLDRTKGRDEVLGALREVALPGEDVSELFTKLVNEFRELKGDGCGQG